MKIIHIDLQSNIEKRFNKNVEITLYRVILELINNCLKHAEANEIHLNLQHSDKAKQLRFTYNDNGLGFDLAKMLTQAKGRGLINMQYRIDSINGKIKMKSSPGNGLHVIIEVPIFNEK